MLRTFVGFPSYFLMWMLAAVSAICFGMRLAERRGFPPAQSLPALAVLSMSVVVGAKLSFFVDRWIFGGGNALVASAHPAAEFLNHGYRNPGGFFLFAISLPLVCRLTRLPTLVFGDAVIPAAGVAIFFFRLGCFLNGCCVGPIGLSPFAISFPPDSPVALSQLAHGILSEPGSSLAVFPLQLAHGLSGLLITWACLDDRRTLHRPGRQLALFFSLYSAVTIIFEQFQVPMYLINTPILIVLLIGSGVWLVLSTGFEGARPQPIH